MVGDDIDEYNESLTITLGGDDLANATLHPTNATVWTYEITDDDDAPTASISASDAAAENIAPDATITLSAASEKVTSFTVTPADVTATLSSDEGVDGGDYYIENSTVSIAAGETTGLIEITGVDDTKYEGNETFTLTVVSDSTNNATINTGTATFTLVDDDVKSNLSFAGTSQFVDENVVGGTVNIPLSLNKASGFDTPITFSVINTDDADAASNPADYGVTIAPITIPTGELTTNIVVTIEDDFSDEVNETVTFNIDDVGDNTNLGQFTTLTLTIVDNDAPPADFTVGDINSISSTDGKDRVGYWGSFHNSLTVDVPVGVISANASLVGGSVQVLAKLSGEDDATYENLGAAIQIDGDNNGTTVQFTISESELEDDLSLYAEGATLIISARITDANSNSTVGTASNTEIIVDQTDPFFSTLTTVTPVGGVVVDGFWNRSNTSIQVTVPTSGLDNSIIGGSIQLQAKVTEGNAFANVGDALNGGLITVTGAEVGANVVMTADLADYQALNTYPADGNGDGVVDIDGLLIYHTALVTDAAGNERVFTESESTLTTDLISPTYTTVTAATMNNGYYKIGDEIVFTIGLSEPVTGTTNTMNMTVALSSGENITRGITTDERSSLVFDGNDLAQYVVQTGNSTFVDGAEALLSVVTITSTDGVFRDLAGNDIEVTTIEVGNNLSDSKDIRIDGVAPSEFTVGAVDNIITTLTNSVQYYWNSSNTGATISLVGIENENSLSGGTIQMTGEINNVATNIGDPIPILNGDLGGTKAITMDAADIESIAGFADGETVYFSAVITDIAGNSTIGTYNALYTFLQIDQTPPEDLDLNSVYSRSDDAVITVPGYINNTNDALIVETNVGADDLNTVVQVQARTESNPGVFTNDVQDQGVFTIPSNTVTQNDINSGFTQTIIPITNDFIDKLVGESLVSPQEIPVNKTIHFRSTLTDLAGNITDQEESAITAIYDTARIENIAITYSSTNINQEGIVIVTATFSERPYYGFNDLSDAPHILIDFPSGTNSINSPMEAQFIGDNGNGIPDAADTNYTVWTYDLDVPDDNTDGTVNVRIHCTDIAGNPSGGYGIDATGADCPEMIDFEGVSPCDQYSNQTGKNFVKY